jgi:hypothetical protein
MGQIGFAIAGGVAGAVGGIFLGNPLLGAAIGFSAGSALGQVIYGTRKADMGLEGSRLGDSTVQSSTYGATLPRVYGRFRLAGNLIWSTGVTDKANPTVDNGDQQQGGKGGIGRQPNDPVYVASLAVAICEGPIISIGKIWADGRLIYNNTGVSIRGAPQYTSAIKVYLGTGAQTADPTMQAAEGAANVPAYLDVAYVVFTEFPLLEFGNRIPNFTFEVLSVSSPQYPITSGTNQNVGTDDTYLAPNASEIYTLSGNIITAIRRSNGTRRAYRDIRAAVATKVGVAAGTLAIASKFFTGLYDEHLWLAFRYNSADTFLVEIEPQSLQPVFTTYSIKIAGEEAAGTVFGSKIYTADKTGSTIRCYAKNTDGSWRRAFTLTGPAATATPGNFAKTFGWLFLLSYEPGSNPGDDDKFYISRITQGGEVWHKTYTGSGRCKAVFGHYSATANPHLIVGSNNQAKLLRVEAPPTGQTGPAGGVSTLAAISQDTDQTSAFRNKGQVYSGHFWFKSGNDLKRLQLDGNQSIDKTIAIASFAGLGSSFTGLAFEPTSEALWVNDAGTIKQLLLSRDGFTTIALSDVVADICSKAGLAAGDYDVSSLAATNVKGYAVTRQMPAREAIKPLALAYQFEAVESDSKIKFVKKGGSTALPFSGYITGANVDSIIEDHLGVSTGEGEEKINKVRATDNDLPWRVSVAYMNADRDYNESIQHDQRYQANIGGRNQITLELPVVITDQNARDLANRLLYTAWIERESFVIHTFFRYILLEPTDIITFQVDGIRYTARVTSTTDGANGVYEINATVEDITIYSNTGDAQSTDVTSPILVQPSPSKLFPLDIPLLRSTDDDAGFYAAVSRLTDDDEWTGTTILRSIDGTNFLSQASIDNEATAGTLETLPAVNYPGNVFDNVDTFRVRIVNDKTLTSDTEINVLNGSNALIVGNGEDAEIIQFKTATLIETGLYELSGLLRGRKGTERSTALHAVGDSVVLVSTSTIKRISPSDTEINARRVLRAASFGLPARLAPITEFTNSAVGLRPYHVERADHSWTDTPGFTSDLTVDFYRRSRVGHEWADYNDIPLGEEEESYEVEIWDDADYLAGDPPTRTKTVSTDQVIYTAGEQAADYGQAGPSKVWMKIYQISATVGRGFTKALSFVKNA